MYNFESSLCMLLARLFASTLMAKYGCHKYVQCQKNCKNKYLQVPRVSYFWAFRSFEMLTGPLFQIKLHSWYTALLNGFQSFPEVRNPLSKAVPGKFHGSGGHSKHNCLQDRRVWQIVSFLSQYVYIYIYIYLGPAFEGLRYDNIVAQSVTLCRCYLYSFHGTCNWCAMDIVYVEIVKQGLPGLAIIWGLLLRRRCIACSHNQAVVSPW